MNSDDPPIFNSTPNEEYLKAAEVFHFDVEAIEKLVFNALKVSFLDVEEKKIFEEQIKDDLSTLRTKYLD